jgi:drug/metabolite transporter (DMT)-like permease
MTYRMTRLHPATLLGFLAVLLWSSMFAFSRLLTESLGTYTTGALIYILGGTLGLVVASRQPGGLALLRRPARYFLICGPLFIGYMVFVYLAIGLAASHAEVVAVALANYLWPSLIMLFSIPILGNRARIWLLPGILLALAGTWLATLLSQAQGVHLADISQVDFLPVGLAALAAILWALYSTLARKWAAQQGSAVPVFLLASGLVFLLLRLFSQEESRWELALLPPALYLIVFPAWLGYLFWDTAMQRGDMPLVTAFSYFTPLLSTLISLLVLQISPSPLLGLAALLVTVGAIVSKFSIE